MTIRACFVSASGQNAFFAELHDAFRSALEDVGVTVEASVDHFPSLEDDLVYVFFPHEYLALVYPEAHPTEAQVARTVIISTEQPGTSWFEENAAAAARAGGVVDINRLGAKELKRRGVRAEVLRLGYVSEWDGWGGDADSPRPIDFTFLGGYTARRARALAACGTVLKDRRSAIHLVDTAKPHTVSSDKFLTGEAKWRHLASSKLILNVHREELPYFEWQRMLAAAANGCVVVTEHSLKVDPLVPGEHFVSATFESLPYAVAALLRDEERLRTMREETHAFLREELPLSASIHVLAEVIEKVGRVPVRSGIRRARNGYDPVPLPADPPEPVRGWVQLLGTPSETDLMRMALKRLVVGQQRIERRLDQLEHGDVEAADDVTAFGPDGEIEPRVTVTGNALQLRGLHPGGAGERRAQRLRAV